MIPQGAPLVSVIMPSFNHERFLSDAIGSVLAQSVGDFELIVIDDASSDRSRLVIERHANADPRIRPIFHQTNKGIAPTMNEGEAAARGRFLAPVGSDDLWERSKLERQLEVLDRDENLIVWSEGTVIDEHGHPTGRLFTEMARATGRKKSGDIFDELLKGNYILGSSRMMKRAPPAGVRRDEQLRYLNDYRYAVDLASRCRYHFVDEPLVRYRRHPGNTVTTDLAGYYQDSVRLRRYLLTEYRERLSLRSRLRVRGYSLRLWTKLACRRVLSSFRSRRIPT
jgi:glycosyltransferase involved in cell wall biosynthesis